MNGIGKFLYQIKQGFLFALVLSALCAIGIQNRLWKVK